MKKVLLLTLGIALFVGASTSAVDMTGKYGLGFWTAESAVGGRYWINEKVGFDLGVGFMMEDCTLTDENGEPKDETAKTISFDVGLMYVVFPTDRANFFIRPGLMYKMHDDEVYVDPNVGMETEFDTESWMMVSATLGAEVFFGDHFSLTAGHGLYFHTYSPAGDGDSETTIGTFGNSLTNVGFTFYFK